MMEFVMKVAKQPLSIFAQITVTEFQYDPKNVSLPLQDFSEVKEMKKVQITVFF